MRIIKKSIFSLIQSISTFIALLFLGDGHTLNLSQGIDNITYKLKSKAL